MNFYCFSGLGADERIFHKLSITGATLHFVPWIEAETEESLPAYALRLGQTIKPKKPFCLLGVSFGGMLATELSRVLQPEHTFLISSALSSLEITPLIRLAGKTGIHKSLPDGFFRHPNFAVYTAFGLKANSEKELFRQIMHDTDIDFLKWAITAIMNWNPSQTQKPKVIRIHGNAHLIIPLKDQKVDCNIKGGTHFCVLQQAGQISKFISSMIT
ncbi:MAG: hypothetical protein Roseis2KO_18680 [Roseivirga sp.]